jgi:hypothetical protein
MAGNKRPAKKYRPKGVRLSLDESSAFRPGRTSTVLVAIISSATTTAF